MQSSRFMEIEDNTINLIAKNYQRTEESLREDVTTLKNWMRTQPHLPEILDDKRIQNFLILNKCSIEKAKQKIDMYYTLRSLIPDMFENINPRCANMKQLKEIGTIAVLPKLTKELYRVLIYKTRNKDLVEQFLQPHDVMGMLINLQEVRLKEDVMFGDVFIFDMRGLPFAYMKKLTPSLLNKVFAIYEKIYSIPLKKLFFVNSPAYINMIMAILRNLLKPKIFDRVIVCQDSSVLAKHFPKEFLPEDYGGEGPPVEELHRLMDEKLREHQDRFDQLDKLRVDESLRPEQLENDEVLGFYGNFKKLSFD